MNPDRVQIGGYYRVTGTDPLSKFESALVEAGSTTTGPSNDGEYSSTCPAHDDHVASLRWRVSVDGRLLFFCHAGCEGSKVIEALGVKWYDLRPTTVDYDYFDAEGTYLYTVRRKNDAGGGKSFTQFQRGADGSNDIDGRGDSPDVLWLEPMLFEWVESARAAGSRGGQLWLVEGEKDVIVASPVVESNVFVTTAPGGAGGWRLDHTETVRRVVASGVISSIVLIGDRDAAGLLRLDQLAEAFEPEFPDIAIAVLVPAKGAGRDLSELIDKHPTDWDAQLVDASPEMSKLLEGSTLTGGLVRVVAPGKKRVIGMGPAEKAKPALTCDLGVVSYDDDGWDLLVTPIGGDPREVYLSKRECASGAEFNKWLIVKAGAARDSGGNARAEAIATALPAFLEWDRSINHAPYSIRSRHCSWVDADTGEPSQYDTDRMVFLDEAGEVLFSVGDLTYGVKGAEIFEGLRWGLEGSEKDAAWALARALSFAEPEVVVRALGYTGSIVLAPWFADQLSVKPGLAATAPSGSGKSDGATRLILALAGCKSRGGATWAAYRRTLESGVSSIRWVDDDPRLTEHKDFKGTLRSAADRAKYSLSDVDAGLTATHSASLVGSPAISAENIEWRNDLAMVERFIWSDLPDPSARTSIYPGKEGEPQWADVVELESEWRREDPEQPLTALAGHVVIGLARRIDRVSTWVSEVGTGRRHESAAIAVALGVRPYVEWLSEVREREGKGWPGYGWDPIYNDWDWVIETADRIREEAKAHGKRDDYTIVSKVIPAALEVHRGRPDTDQGRQLRASVFALDFDGLSSEIRRVSGPPTPQGKEVSVGQVPIVLVDQDQRVWVDPAGLARWWFDHHNGRIEDRTEGKNALISQLRRIRDNPEWATHAGVRNKPGARAYVKGSGNVTFHRLSSRHSGAVLDAES